MIMLSKFSLNVEVIICNEYIKHLVKKWRSKGKCFTITVGMTLFSIYHNSYAKKETCSYPYFASIFFWEFQSDIAFLFELILPSAIFANFVLVMFLWQAIPAMLLALVLSFDHRKIRDSVNLLDINSSKGHKYIWYALAGYAIGLVTALAAGVLTHSPQPALLYLVFFFFNFNFCVCCYLSFFFFPFFMIFVKFVGIFCKYLCIQILFAQFFLAVYWSIVYIWLHIKLTSTNLSQQLLWSALLVQIFASMRFLVSFIGLYGW